MKKRMRSLATAEIPVLVAYEVATDTVCNVLAAYTDQSTGKNLLLTRARMPYSPIDGQQTLTRVGKHIITLSKAEVAELAVACTCESCGMGYLSAVATIKDMHGTPVFCTTCGTELEVLTDQMVSEDNAEADKEEIYDDESVVDEDVEEDIEFTGEEALEPEAESAPEDDIVTEDVPADPVLENEEVTDDFAAPDDGALDESCDGLKNVPMLDDEVDVGEEATTEVAYIAHELLSPLKDGAKKQAVELIASTANSDVYYVMMNGLPVGRLVGEKVASTTIAKLWPDAIALNKAFITAAADGVDQEVTDNFGLEPLTINVSPDKVMQQQTNEAVEQTISELKEKAEENEEQLTQALSTATLGICKGFYEGLDNPLRTAIAGLLEDHGVEDPQVLVSKTLASAAEPFFRMVLSKTKELLNETSEVRDTHARLIAQASYIGAGTSSIEDRATRRLRNAAVATASEEDNSRVVPIDKHTDHYSRVSDMLRTARSGRR